ncbi:MAG: hypothetical protein AB7O67_19235 [Vicinamibacterales bacterium]
MRSKMLWTAAGVLAASLLGAGTASAQQQFTLSGGYFAVRGEDARVEGDVLNVNREIFLFDVSDFGSATVGAEWVVPVGEYLEAGGRVGFVRRTVPSVYRDYVRPDGTEIEQDFRLRTVPISGTLRILPLGRSAPIQPYVGGGIVLVSYRYSETGDFIDFSDPVNLPVFRDSYVASGTAVGAEAVFGLRVPAGPLAFGGEVRYQKAEADLSNDFLGSKLDLGGLHWLGTISFRF